MRDSINGAAKWLGAGLALVFLALLAWQGWEATHADGAAGASVKASQILNPNVRWGEMFSPDEVAKYQALPASAAGVGPQRAALAKDEVEVCGLGSAKLNAEGDLLQPELVQVPIDTARDRVVATLGNSANELNRAAGLVLKGVWAVPPQDEKACAADGCVAEKARAAATAARREELVHMALTTQQPRVYALAMQACQLGHAAGSNCSMLSSAQWARLDPDNAAPWMMVAYEADRRGDKAAVDEAMFQVSKAKVSDLGVGTVMGVVVSQLPADLPPVVKSGVLLSVVGADLAMPATMPMGTTTKYCSAAGVQDSNRQQTCAAVADVLTEKGKSMIERQMGIRVGERTGWSKERVAALRDESTVMSSISEITGGDSSSGAWGCANTNKFTKYIDNLGREGEVVAMRLAVQQSGKSMAEHLQALHETQARRLASVAADGTVGAAVGAASAASAPQPALP